MRNSASSGEETFSTTKNIALERGPGISFSRHFLPETSHKLTWEQLSSPLTLGRSWLHLPTGNVAGLCVYESVSLWAYYTPRSSSVLTWKQQGLQQWSGNDREETSCLWFLCVRLKMDVISCFPVCSCQTPQGVLLCLPTADWEHRLGHTPLIFTGHEGLHTYNNSRYVFAVTQSDLVRFFLFHKHVLKYL